MILGEEFILVCAYRRAPTACCANWAATVWFLLAPVDVRRVVRRVKSLMRRTLDKATRGRGDLADDLVRVDRPEAGLQA